MELILTDHELNDIEFFDNCDADFSLGNGDNTFEIKISRSSWNQNYGIGAAVYIPNTEFGGYIGEIKSQTSLDTVSLLGRTWRGMMQKKIILPDNGSTVKTVSGDITSILIQLINPAFSNVIKASEILTGKTVSHEIIGYSTMLDAIELMLEEYGYKLLLKFKQQNNAAGYIEASAVPIADYSSEIELSNDNQIDFIFDTVKNGVNHLVVLNPESQTKLDLYADSNGNISQTKSFTGIEEIEELYECNESDSAAFKQSGIEQFKTVMNRKSFSMDVESLDLDIDIGDIIGGRDYITGMSLKKPIKTKIYRIENNSISLEYGIEGED